MLTHGQKMHFHTFGYLSLREVFSSGEAETIRTESEDSFSQNIGKKLPDGRQTIQPFFECQPFSSRLVDDDRIYEISEDLLGPDFFLIMD